MATLGHARRHTTFSAIITLAAAALLSPIALMSASVCTKSLPLEIYSTAVGEIGSIALDHKRDSPCPLADVVDEFNRYNIRKLLLADRSISVISIGGNFRPSDVQGFVAAPRPMGIRSTRREQNRIRLMGTTGAH